jgi:predicted ribosomally synthesized peptide with nif11-like leader
MSVHTVQEFWKQVGQDVDLQKQLQSLPADNPAETAAMTVQIAGDAGFVFSADDYERSVKDHLGREHAAGELDEKELDQVAGGRMARGCSVSVTVSIDTICD